MLDRSGNSGKCFMWQEKNAASGRKSEMPVSVK
ncbi:plasmid replication initiation protein [Salmonella enterica]|nr:plasmid replication initiation protein [Salmonella enterica]